jgi:hypothetical protein
MYEGGRARKEIKNKSTYFLFKKKKKTRTHEGSCIGAET